MVEVSIVTTFKGSVKEFEAFLANISHIDRSVNWESVVFIDDYREVRSELEEIVNAWPRLTLGKEIMLVGEEVPVGRAKALNIAIASTRADVVAILDADDVWSPSKLDRQLSISKANPNAIVCSNYNVFSSHTVSSHNVHNLKSALVTMTSNDTSNWRKIREIEFFIRNPVMHSSALGPKRFFKYDEKLNSNLDIDCWIGLLAKKISFLISNEPLCICVKHPNQNFEKMGLIYSVRSLAIRLKYARQFKFGLLYSLVAVTKTVCIGVIPPEIKNKIRSLLRNRPWQ